jgi:hypothetical protein
VASSQVVRTVTARSAEDPAAPPLTSGLPPARLNLMQGAAEVVANEAAVLSQDFSEIECPIRTASAS